MDGIRFLTDPIWSKRAGYFSGFAEIGEALGPFDLAAVPIGAYEPSELMRLSHMDPEQALQAAVDVGARTAIAMHFGTFDPPLKEYSHDRLKATRWPHRRSDRSL